MYKLRKFHKKPYILNRALLFYDSKNLVDLHEIASATPVPMTPRSPSRSQSGTATPRFTIVSRVPTSNSAMPPKSQSQSRSRSRSVSNEASTEITTVAGESAMSDSGVDNEYDNDNDDDIKHSDDKRDDAPDEFDEMIQNELRLVFLGVSEDASEVLQKPE